MNSINPQYHAHEIPCNDDNFKKLCSEYSGMLLCCDAVKSEVTQHRERGKILRGKADCADIFELKQELLKTKHFKFKAASWCMYPVLKKGDVLKVEPVRREEMKIDDIPVYRSGGRLYAHRIVDKQIIDGKGFVITRADQSGDMGDVKSGEKLSEEEILGIIKEVKRGKKTLSIKRRKATIWELFLYKKTTVYLNSIALLKKVLKTILAKIQSFKLYEAIGRRLTARVTPYLNFELACPFANKILNQVYDYAPLRDNKKINFSRLKKSKIFHLVLKFNNNTLGCASFLNRPDGCPYKGLWLSDIYIRLRYRGLNFDSILLQKAKEVLRRTGINNEPRTS